ncbi:MAG TPA: hypothetical protein VK980_12860, partial [Sphingomonas sp.]|nr:hypothetical protein [Sphingomonas sp.]
ASGRLKPKSCEAYPNDTKACDSLAGELRVTDIGSIDTCETDDASDCYNVTFGDRGLKIIVERQRIWPVPAGAPAEGAIRSVVFESYVIIADARID